MKIIFIINTRMNEKSHKRLIAAGECCSIEECTCGTIHLTLGALTLRVPREAIESIWVTIGAAIRRLEGEAVHASSSSARLSLGTNRCDKPS